MVLKNTLSKVTLLSSAVALLALAACGPTPTGPATPGKGSIRGISVNELVAAAEGGSSKVTVQLAWSPFSSNVEKVSLFRAENDGSPVVISTPDRNAIELTDADPSVKPGNKYTYTIKGVDKNNETVSSAVSAAIDVLDLGDIQTFNVLKPAANDEKMKDPTGLGLSFEWADAGTGLYHVQVSDRTGTVLWAGFTTQTKITYGTQSGTSGPQSTIVNPKLVAPQGLTKIFPISSRTPNASRNEVAYKGIAANNRILVRAIKTMPNNADLASANAIAIKPATEIRFDAE
ncbi:MAG: hypothetical protein IV090_05810 [Candidatus Sericytochromatia bacterium]|nr:hypothetical protein [Candidatus Sericytochromatia bacterium]